LVSHGRMWTLPWSDKIYYWNNKTVI
jgi:hypothetical protein